MKLKLLIMAMVGLASVCFGEPTTQPAKSEQYQQGLIAEIYDLPRRPKKIRNLLPGLTAASVRVVESPKIAGDDDVLGHNGNVQIEYAGEIEILKSGSYKFVASADDGMDLTIDGQPILFHAWINGPHSPTEKAVTLTQGWHAFRVRFYQGDGGFNLRLRWQTPDSGEVADIPPARFRVSKSRVEEGKAMLSIDEKSEGEDPARAHRSIFRSKGFFELPEAEGDLMVDLLEGTTVLSEAARKDIGEAVRQTNYQKLPYWHQVKVLSGFLRGWYWGQVKRSPVTKRAEYQLLPAEATEYNGWRGKKRQGFKHVVKIGDQQFTIYTPSADSPERENVAGGIAGLPQALRKMLRYVTVEPYGTANEFNGGGDSIWIRRGGPTPRDMIDGTFSHEIGHLLMNKANCYLAWEEAVGKDVLSVSHYGRLNPSEDFAEFVSLYLSTDGDPVQISNLRQIFPARSAVLEKALKDVEFSWE